MADLDLLQAVREVKHLSIMSRYLTVSRLRRKKSLSVTQRDLLELLLIYPEAAERVLLERISKPAEA